jgi:beta-phosphoglucomutase-like phosphatase (HAD superfamily)
MIRIFFLILQTLFFFEGASVQASIENTIGDIKAIIFDCDGTLVDTEEAQYEAWVFAFQQQGYELTKQEYLQWINSNSLSGLPAANIMISKIGAEMLGCDRSQELLNDMHFYLDILRIKGFPPIEPTVNFLLRLVKEKEILGIKLGLASGGTKQQILTHLKHLGIENYFDVILSGSEDLWDYTDPEGTNKPKPYIYLQAAKLLGFLPTQCVAIEDSLTGVTSAVEAGCITVAIPNTATSQHDLSHAHLKIDSFEGINTDHFFRLINSINISSSK